MAEGQMMTPADVVAQGAMAGEDFVRDAVGLVVRELMEAEVAKRSAPGSARSRRARRRISTGTARGRGRRGSARSSC